QQQKVVSREGVAVPVRADTVCLHGDGEHALAFARRLREAFRQQNIQVSA
ncbi:MAG: LamB/YcsF family protein, partial [Ewingella sp.]|nr:LamB/YcsF family protein [Ewingella sp.]